MWKIMGTALAAGAFAVGVFAAQPPDGVELVMFMGQSNMAGRGSTVNAVACPPEAGREYRGDVEPELVAPITATFGAREKGKDAPYHDYRRTGTMVPSLVKHLYEKTGVPVFGVAASRGGSPSAQWRPETPYLNAAVERLDRARDYLKRHNVKIRRCYMVWVQGCSDGDKGVDGETYKKNLTDMFAVMKSHGVEVCFVSQIGHQQNRHHTKEICPVSQQKIQLAKLGKPQKYWHWDFDPVRYPQYEVIQRAQEELCRDNPDFVLVSRIAKGFALTPYQRDAWHYAQEGYNLIGRDMGRNIAAYLQTGKKPYCQTWEELDARLAEDRHYILRWDRH